MEVEIIKAIGEYIVVPICVVVAIWVFFNTFTKL
jgi:hypothetical protein